MHDCSIRVTAVLHYLKPAFHLPGCVAYFHYASIMNTAKPILMECVIMKLSRGVVLAVLDHY